MTNSPIPKPKSINKTGFSKSSIKLLHVQIIFSSLVLLFCMYEIMISKNNESLSVYWGGIMSILGYWFPSPLDSNNNNGKQ